MAVHANSLAAWASLDTKARRDAIMTVFTDAFLPLTDHEVMERLGFQDGNAVKPRISEMVAEGKLVEVDKARDHITGKTVRRCVAGWLLK